MNDSGRNGDNRALLDSAIHAIQPHEAFAVQNRLKLGGDRVVVFPGTVDIGDKATPASLSWMLTSL